jgi:diamine N-acetyltransferase
MNMQNSLDTSHHAQLTPLTREDFATVTDLAHRIWHAHYGTIITHAQIDYMLGRRFTEPNLAQYVAANDRWFELLRLDDHVVGYCSWSRTADPEEMKLEQLYVLPELHGRGLGKLMLQRIERDSRDRGCRSLMLTVNKHNENALKVYLRTGFIIREEAVFDIGNGYVMDDYVMAKPLSG